MKFIAMKNFRSVEAEKRVSFDREIIVLGQIIGHVVAFKVREVVDQRDGTISQSIVLIGDFNAVCYEEQAKAVAAGKPASSVEMDAEQVFMPKWFAETVMEKLKVNNGAPLEFAAEIVMLPTPVGSTIKYQYDVRSLLSRKSTSPIERMKQTLQAKGTLRLSAPIPDENFADPVLIGGVGEPVTGLSNVTSHSNGVPPELTVSAKPAAVPAGEPLPAAPTATVAHAKPAVAKHTDKVS